MITELLDSAINQVLYSGIFEISEFQLGKDPYNLLKHEVESKLIGASVNIHTVNTFKGIPVSLHSDHYAIIYFIKLKRT